MSELIISSQIKNIHVEIGEKMKLKLIVRCSFASVLVCCLLMPTAAHAQRGGKGGSRAPSTSRPSGGFNRTPSMSRPSTSRPAPRPSVSRPSPSVRPSRLPRPSVARPPRTAFADQATCGPPPSTSPVALPHGLPLGQVPACGPHCLPLGRVPRVPRARCPEQPARHRGVHRHCQTVRSIAGK